MPNAFIRDFLDRGYSLEETHISWVLLGERDAWKIKKPVNLGFLDFTSLEKRRQACEAEVALNRRFTPHVYLGAVPIALDAQGKYRFGGEGQVVDWAVRMVRLRASDRADIRMEEGRLSPEHLRSLARRMADTRQSRANVTITCGRNLHIYR
jgi:aminoglycoside phosphotransferase family enzyme